jgi:ACS family sodium-dependent inorganic phosphate cotransporter
VAPSRAGAFLGLTNTLGVGAGIAANLLTGYILETTGSFALVFVVTAGMYVSCGVVWNTFLRGRMLFP